MPLYEYGDARGHRREVVHRMLYGTAIVCECGLTMRRIPQAPAVNWGGLAPDRGEPCAEVQKLIRTAPQRRAEFEKEHAQHERRTD